MNAGMQVVNPAVAASSGLKSRHAASAGNGFLLGSGLILASMSHDPRYARSNDRAGGAEQATIAWRLVFSAGFCG